MIVVTWNLGGNSGYRDQQSQAWQYMWDALGADFALVQEASNPGLPENRFVFKPVHAGWGTAVASRDRSIRQFALPGEPTRTAAANTVLADGLSLYLVSLHIQTGTRDPSTGRRQTQWVVPQLYQLFELIGGALGSFRFVVGGDINAGRIWDTKQRAAPDKQHTPFFEWAHRVGFHDAHWSLNKKEVPTYPSAAPIVQNDHIFVGSTMAEGIQRCNVTSSQEVKNLSDHLPVILELAIPMQARGQVLT